MNSNVNGKFSIVTFSDLIIEARKTASTLLHRALLTSFLCRQNETAVEIESAGHVSVDSKDQESIQSSTTPIPGYQMGK